MTESKRKPSGKLEDITKLMPPSLPGALRFRDLACEKKLNVPPEGDFNCGLLHALGKIIPCIYMPEIYKKIESGVGLGIPEKSATRKLLEDLTFADLVQEIAVEVDAPGAFPKRRHYLVKGRTVYLFPIVVSNKTIALLYTDREAGQTASKPSGCSVILPPGPSRKAAI